MIIGTNHFMTHVHAYKYYQAYGYRKEDVNVMIETEAIVIGKPAQKPNEVVFLNRECRYMIEVVSDEFQEDTMYIGTVDTDTAAVDGSNVPNRHNRDMRVYINSSKGKTYIQVDDRTASNPHMRIALDRQQLRCLRDLLQEAEKIQDYTQ